MATRISPITARLGKLSIGGGGGGSSSSSSSIGTTSRTSIRLAHTAKKKKAKKGERIEPSFEPGFGEKIFIFNHFVNGMTVYSHRPVLKANHALRQIPFNGKKLKPAKLRKDYWRPMAMIQFPDGQGEAGRSVFSLLRECKKLHEYSWDNKLLYDTLTGRTLTTHERGARLNDQRANTIADMAAVLGGLGKGNKLVVAPAPAGGEGGPAKENTAPVVVDQGKTLIQASVWWWNEIDKYYAENWTKNVSHEYFEQAVFEPRESEEGSESQSAPAELVAEQELTKGPEQSRKL